MLLVFVDRELCNRVEPHRAEIGHQMAAQVMTEQGDIANNVENLVPGGLIRKAEPILDWTAPAKNEQVCRCGPGPQALAS